MKKYETNYISHSSNDFGDIVDRISKMGSEGWLMTGVVEGSHAYDTIYWFMREIEDKEEDCGPY